MTLTALKTALDATGIPFAHHAWSHAPSGSYGVFAEDSTNNLFASDSTAERAIQGTVDLFTRDDGETIRETVETALEGLGIPWYLNSIQFESETKRIHYEWVFEVI